MSVLSEWDIINELGRGILIYPFEGKDKSLRGCCLCLTASEYAYIFPIEPGKPKITKRLVMQTDTTSKKSFFIIPKGTSAVVWVNESVFLNGHFCGSVHSKVKLVSSGIGHIGTRVNPNWKGIFAIALHNLSNNDIPIYLGETIAYLRLHKLMTESSYTSSTDPSGKLHDAIPEGFDIPRELNEWINNDVNNPWRKGERDDIWKVLKESDGYKTAKNALRKKSVSYRMIYQYLPQWEPNVWLNGVTAISSAILALIGLISLSIALTPKEPKQTTSPAQQEVPIQKVDPKRK